MIRKRDLGMWVAEQRRRKSKLSADRIEAIERIPGWSWDPLADEFAEFIYLATQYAKDNGNRCLPPKRKTKVPVICIQHGARNQCSFIYRM